LRDALDPDNRDSFAHPGTRLIKDESRAEGWWLEPESDELQLVRANIFTLPPNGAASLNRACLDMEGDVCEHYQLDRTCDFGGQVLPMWATENIIRQRIVEQECYSCPFNVASTDGRTVNVSLDFMPDFSQWGMALSRVRELRAATGVNIVWASVAMNRMSDWTPSTIAVYLLWLTPAIASLALPLGLLLFRVCRPRDAVLNEVLTALHRVEIEEVRERWYLADSRAHFCGFLVRYGVIAGAALLRGCRAR
jgi:hypothetical protein